MDQRATHDQVLSAAVGPETTYVPKPMLVETIDHDTAYRILRGLRKEEVTHTVQQGETLSKIATQYGVNVATLLERNSINIADVSRIKPGTNLTIPPEKTTDSLAWLDKLHENERKAREEQLAKEQKAKLARLNQRRGSIARAADEESSDSNGGKFRKPIGVSCHNGYHTWAVDCLSAIGTSILAAAGGVVEVADASGYNGGYGKMVKIDHGNGWVTLYAHMSQVSLSSGESVSAGTPVGLVGMTGHTTGPHVHFEIQKNGQRLNPCNYISCYYP